MSPRIANSWFEIAKHRLTLDRGWAVFCWLEQLGDLNGSFTRLWQRKATINKTEVNASPIGYL